ncbi:hypothetical protein PVAP13_8KG307450 [Panicum virgatum]|uniref:Uncharacterized protein n=1 Tax=Panicum virgatum TaxID=38727 RepID=A0A8T0PRQ7_PANVG|nr:hypothetical protein PVAP13_8KG307450 [Panicum virgatum]
MNSGEGTPADQTCHAPLPLVASEPRHRLWADLPADILGIVVGRLALAKQVSVSPNRQRLRCDDGLLRDQPCAACHVVWHGGPVIFAGAGHQWRCGCHLHGHGYY